MKTLVVFYSRTNTTKKVAEALAVQLGADVEEIIDTVNRKGIWGFFISGRDGMKRRLTKLEAPKFDPAGYDLVIVGTPIWAANMSSPVRTYLTEQKDKMKQVAFFCTMGGEDAGKTFVEMEEAAGKKPLATLALRTKRVVKEDISGDISAFAEAITKGA